MYIYCITTYVMLDSTDTAKSTGGDRSTMPDKQSKKRIRKQNKHKNVQTEILIKVIY